MIKKRATIVGLLILVFLAGCSSNEGDLLQSPYKQTEFLMGTVVTVKIYDEGKENVLDSVFNRIEMLAEQIGVGEVDSQIDEVNANAGEKPTEVTDDVFELVQAGKSYSEQAEGSFDITIGPLTSLWHIGYDDARKPEQAEIDEVLSLINYKKVTLDEENKTVYLEDENMQMDLGAIAKGFIADEVNEVLDENGVTTSIIDLGGNIFVKGNNPSGDKWTVGIQDPFSARGETVGKIEASDQSIVTSGIYERYLEVDGVSYHHLLNPIDGYPFDNEIAGVTIVSEKSIDGDALSTVVFSKGLEGGMAFIENQEGVEAIFVNKDNQIFITSGLEDEFQLTNDSFQLGEL
ncbi:FAD:protein FMN transferase [Paraliobacillus quinghaiensis]|uniref:FAD:protein FMN transferase n=1 Tax=Paraliobacillus quinghaiensis TaxID=470815 RepID=A0A917TTA0_9BACI|nr:FAD:protein FMN transferase [Paraliobacillus quinghaiensis]